MGFGFARRRRDELETVSDGDPAPPTDRLARYAYAEAEDDEAPTHQHAGPCNCGLRGE